MVSASRHLPRDRGFESGFLQGRVLQTSGSSRAVAGSRAGGGCEAHDRIATRPPGDKGDRRSNQHLLDCARDRHQRRCGPPPRFSSLEAFRTPASVLKRTNAAR